MPDRRKDSRQIIAVLFITLLVGGECARMSTELGAINVMGGALENRSQRQATRGPMGVFWSHNDVCRPREMNSQNRSTAAQRYVVKYTKIQQVMAHLHEEACSNGCVKSWIELKSRVMHFKSCTSVTEKSRGDSESVPETVSQLRQAMTSKATSFTQLFTDTLSTISTALNKRNMFPPGAKCSFDPSKLNITKAQEASQNADDQRRILWAQIFGHECVDGAPSEYLGTLSEAARRTAHATMRVVNRAIELAQGVQSSPSKDEAEMEEEGENTAKELHDIVKTAREPGDDDHETRDDLNDEELEELVETNEASDDGLTSSNSTALVETRAGWGDSPNSPPYSWFEFWIGLIVIIVTQALVGTVGKPWILSIQRSYYTARYR